MLRDEREQSGDEYKVQLQGMLSQKQQVQDSLSAMENDLSRCTKDRDKQKLIATQQATQISELKDQVRSESDQSKLL